MAYIDYYKQVLSDAWTDWLIYIGYRMIATIWKLQSMIRFAVSRDLNPLGFIYHHGDHSNKIWIFVMHYVYSICENTDGEIEITSIDSW